MPSLRELQRAFAAGVYDDAQTVLAHVRDGAFPAARHLQIYRHNTLSNLTDALAAVYPVIRRLVGENFFEGTAAQFTKLHPPHSGNLHDFGAQFGDFLATFEPTRDLVYLSDVARLEWAWHCAFHAGDAAPILLDALAAVPIDRHAGLVFQLHPSAHLIASNYPILGIWQVNQPDVDGDTAVNLDTGGECLLVARRGVDVEIASLNTGEYAMLNAFVNRKTLADAAMAALANEPNFDLGECLRRHVAAGIIIGFAESQIADQEDK